MGGTDPPVLVRLAAVRHPAMEGRVIDRRGDLPGLCTGAADKPQQNEAFHRARFLGLWKLWKSSDGAVFQGPSLEYLGSVKRPAVVAGTLKGSSYPLMGIGEAWGIGWPHGVRAQPTATA